MCGRTVVYSGLPLVCAESHHEHNYACTKLEAQRHDVFTRRNGEIGQNGRMSWAKRWHSSPRRYSSPSHVAHALTAYKHR
jgi:hypothetical protein